IGEREHYDLILDMKRTPERERQIAFTQDYLQFPWVIIIREESGFIGGVQDLSGKTVAVERGYVMQEKLQNEYPGISLLETETSQAAIEAVATGRADAYIGNLANATHQIQKHGLDNLKIAAPTPFDNHDQAMGVRKDWPELASIIDKAIATMTPEEHQEIRNRWMSVRYEMEFDYSLIWKVLLGIAVLFGFVAYWNRRLAREVDQRRLAEIAQRTAREEAEQANRAKSIFLANMSHELRTPLNAVLGFSQLMGADKQLSSHQRSNLEIINRSGHHLLQLINDVLDMSKIEAGKIGLEMENIDLGALIRDVLDMMRERAEQKGLQLIFDQSSDFPRFVRGDGPKIRQILINLLSNGIKFTDFGGVTLRLKAKNGVPGQITLQGEVQDSGQGIAPEDMDRIFLPFEQLVSSAEQKGTGLGLAITRQFVELMDGEISAQSRPGKGSTFSFHIQVEPGSEEEAFVSEQRESSRVIGLAEPVQEWRILIAEDQPENQALLQQLLKQVGFRVRVAEDGKKAVQIYQQWHPHFIWMDRRMPRMDGLAATRKIRQLPGGDKVIIAALTASVFLEQRNEVMEAGS
ncbi:MAG: transporter substrate-binding domain-containing protein, partial [Sedimenticola sp.]